MTNSASEQCPQSVHLGEADEDGVPWFDVLDARSGDTAMYTDLIDSDGSCYSEWVESTLEPFGSNLLILERIRNQTGIQRQRLRALRSTIDDHLVSPPTAWWRGWQ